MIFDIPPQYIAVSAAMLCTYLGYLQGKSTVPNPQDVIEDTIDSLLEQGYLKMDENEQFIRWDD